MHCTLRKHSLQMKPRFILHFPYISLLNFKKCAGITGTVTVILTDPPNAIFTIESLKDLSDQVWIRYESLWYWKQSVYT